MDIANVQDDRLQGTQGTIHDPHSALQPMLCPLPFYGNYRPKLAGHLRIL